MNKQKHSNEDESLVIWILTFVIIAFGALTIGSYSDIPQQTHQESIVKNGKIQPEIASDGLIKANTHSQKNTNTFKM